jgi:hypothetical protein
MHPILRLMILVVGTVALTTTSHSVDPASSPLQTPAIVKQLFRSETVAIPTTTLFTAKSTGLYRISAYLAMTTTGTSGCPWNFEMSWTDDAGAEGPLQLLQVSDKWKPPFDYSFGPTAGYQQTLILRAVAGTAVTYDVNDSDCNAAGTYQISATVERIQ